MENNIQKVLLSQQMLQDRIQQMAAQINEEYADKTPVFVCVLKGVVMFFAEFVKHITSPCEMDFMRIFSYANTESTGKVNMSLDISTDLKGRHVVILEDIFDTGKTLEFTYHHLMEKNPASVKIVTLLDKPERRDPSVTVQADYTGFVIPN